MHNLYRILSPAKLNLGLQILGRTEQGIHILNSLFCKINLYDQLFFKVNFESKSIIAQDWSQSWSYQHDLIFKAAKMLQDYSGCNYGLIFKVQKNIPVGAGLGGGSSNAATTLHYLNVLWGLHYTSDVLIMLARKLGDDVAFFLYQGSTQYCNFIHSRVQLPKLYFVIIAPKIPLSTVDVFNLVRKNKNNFTPARSQQHLLKSQENDLLPYAIKLNKNLALIVAILTKMNINIKMTGSGSVLYISYINMAKAQSDAKNLAKILRGYYNFLKVVRKTDLNMCQCTQSCFS